MKEDLYFKCDNCGQVVVKFDAQRFLTIIPMCGSCNSPMKNLNSFGEFKRIKILNHRASTSFVCVFENCEISNCSICPHYDHNQRGYCNFLKVTHERCGMKGCRYLCDLQYVYLINKISELTGRELPYTCCGCSNENKLSPEVLAAGRAIRELIRTRRQKNG